MVKEAKVFRIVFEVQKFYMEQWNLDATYKIK